MKIEYLSGDIVKSDISHIMHGCNARGVMGSGVAKRIREIYPEAYELYNREYEFNGLRLGNVYSSYQPMSGVTIHNAITQENYGRTEGEVYVSYWALANCLKTLDGKMKVLAMPKIGSGLGNGNWNTIVDIIENTLTRTRPVVYEYP